MTAPRRTLALVRAERALQRARERLAAGERGWDPWRVTEAQARYDAALADALDAGSAGRAPDPDDDLAGGVPRMLLGRGGR